MKRTGLRALPWAGVPVAGEVPAFPQSLAVKVHGKHMCVHAHIHVHTHTEGPHTITFPGALWPTIVSSSLIFLNQVTELTSGQAGERKQMLARPGRSELGHLSWWVNLPLRQDAAPCKAWWAWSLFGFGSCSAPENSKPQLTRKARFVCWVPA